MENTAPAITLYSKPACVQCTMTKKALDKAGLAYQEVDLTQTPAALEFVTVSRQPAQPPPQPPGTGPCRRDRTVLNETDTTTGTGARWWTDEYTAVPDPIEADTDYSFDTSAEAAEHGTPWAVLENPDAYTNGPVSLGHYITAGHHPEAAHCLASREPVRDADRGTWFCFS